MNPRDLIDYAAQDDAVNFRASMYAAIHDKVTAAIENRKQDIAQGLLNQESVVNEGTMTHITLGKKVKNGDGGHDQTVHYKGEHIGSISSYSHRTGTRYGMEHKNGELSAGMRSPEEALDDLRSAHADHMRNMKESVVNEDKNEGEKEPVFKGDDADKPGDLKKGKKPHGYGNIKSEETETKKPAFPSAQGRSELGKQLGNSSSGGKTTVKSGDKPGINSVTKHSAGNRYSGKY
jgi:hypothetical protein